MAQARDFNPLSAPRSITVACEAELDASESAFLCALRVFSGESSKPKPLDQEGSVSVAFLGPDEEEKSLWWLVG